MRAGHAARFPLANKPGRAPSRSFASAVWTANWRWDSVAVAEEELPGQPLLREIMRDGRRIAELPPLHSSREYFLAQLADLPAALRKLEDGGRCPLPGAHLRWRASTCPHG